MKLPDLDRELLRLYLKKLQAGYGTVDDALNEIVKIIHFNFETADQAHKQEIDRLTHPVPTTPEPPNIRVGTPPPRPIGEYTENHYWSDEQAKEIRMKQAADNS